MVKGRPDWVRTTTLKDIRDVFGNIPEVSMGELAARLNSVNYFERRGEVVFLDDFEDSTLKWYADGVEAGWSVLRSNVTARDKNYSLKLTTGAQALDYVYARHNNYLPTSTRLGFENSFVLGSDIFAILTSLHFFDGTNEYYGQFEYLPPTDDLRIKIGVDKYFVLETDLDLKEEDYTFHTWKLVVDLKEGKYVRGFLNNKEYNLSAHDLLIDESPDIAPYMYVMLYVINYHAGAVYAYIDNVIYTQNEP